MLRYMTGLQKNREDLNSMLVLRNVLERRGNFYGSGGGGGGGDAQERQPVAHYPYSKRPLSRTVRARVSGLRLHLLWSSGAE